jgi:hypothetical protein
LIDGQVSDLGVAGADGVSRGVGAGMALVAVKETDPTVVAVALPGPLNVTLSSLPGPGKMTTIDGIPEGDVYGLRVNLIVALGRCLHDRRRATGVFGHAEAVVVNPP